MSQVHDSHGVAAKVRPPDTRLIELDSRGELDYWIKIFHTTEDQLLAAISEMGPYAGAVYSHLKSAGVKKVSQPGE